MKKYIGNIAGAWLGFSVAYFCGFNCLSWQFYVVVIPTIALFALSAKKNKQTE